MQPIIKKHRKNTFLSFSHSSQTDVKWTYLLLELDGSIDELEKQLYIKKKLLKWANKKCKYFNIYKNKKHNKKIKKKTWRYHYFIPVLQQFS